MSKLRKLDFIISEDDEQVSCQIEGLINGKIQKEISSD